MAYIITNIPEIYSSVNDDVIYTVQDSVKVADPVTYPNFKFIGDVYIGGILVARIKKVPDPVTGIGIFNIGQIIRNYLTATFDPTANVIVAQQAGNAVWNIDVVMQFGEEYSFTEFLGLLIDASRLYYNHYNGLYFASASNISGLTNRVLSARPVTNKTILTSKFNFISYFPTVVIPVTFAITPTGGGSIYATTFTPANASDLQILNVSPVAINAVAPGTITANTTSYQVQIGSNFYIFNIICESQYSVTTLHFMNQYGGFDTVFFTKVSRSTVDIQRSDFGKIKYQVDAAGAVTFSNPNHVSYDTRTTYSVIRKSKLQLNSDLLTDAEYTWMADLLASPMIYIEKDSYFFPVAITDNSYEPRKTINDELTNLTINIEYGNQFNSQYR